MAAASGRKSATLADQLLNEPYRFDFFQAVRVVERMHRERARGQAMAPVGRDHEPAREVLRFRALQSLSFAPSSISEVRGRDRSPPGNDDEDDPRSSQLEMVVSFMGLTGPSGVLPQHYTRLLIQRIRDKDHSLQDFLDVFNHRLISFFFRAWEKYRFPTAYERARVESREEEDLFSSALYSLVGLGTGGLQRRMDLEDEAFLFYSGLFADSHRGSNSLERLLSEYFGLEVEVLQFHGQWLTINPNDRSVLPTKRHPKGQNCQLGGDLVLGEKIWDVQSKFRLRMGPLTHRQFRRLIPSGDTVVPLCQMVRTYVGVEVDFDVQLAIQAAEIPPLRLGSTGEDQPFLGWTTWAVSQPITEDFEDVVFSLSDV